MIPSYFFLAFCCRILKTTVSVKAESNSAQNKLHYYYVAIKIINSYFVRVAVAARSTNALMSPVQGARERRTARSAGTRC